MRGRNLTASIVTLSSLLGIGIRTAPPATAQFPGTNGHVAFTSERDGNREIYSMPPGGGPVIRLTNNSIEDSDPQISPNGGAIAFVSLRDGNAEIFTMNLVGGNVAQVTSTGGGISNLQPSWSPDGTRVTFSSNRAGGDYEIYSASAIGLESNVVQLTNNSVTDTGPSYSPDGTAILFNSNPGGNFDLYELQVASPATVRRMTFSSATDFGGDYLPDGSGIVFASNRPGNFDVFRSVIGPDMQTSDGNALNLSNRPQDESEPEPSPDGTKVLTEGFDPITGQWQLFEIDLATLGSSRLTSTPQRNGDPAMGSRVPQCRDGEDNDGDVWTDYPEDPGCESSEDETENPNPECSDGVDNDGDGFTDWNEPYPTSDPSCDDYRDDEGRVRLVTTTFTSFRHGSPFRGAIDAATRRCLEDRGIRIRMVDPGDDPLVAADLTDAGGKFAASHARNLHQRQHAFYAQAIAFAYFSPNNEVYIRCSSAKSERIVVPAGG